MHNLFVVATFKNKETQKRVDTYTSYEILNIDLIEIQAYSADNRGYYCMLTVIKIFKNLFYFSHKN